MKLIDRISNVLHITFCDKKKWIDEYDVRYWISDIVGLRLCSIDEQKHHQNVYAYLKRNLRPIIKKYCRIAQKNNGSMSMKDHVITSERVPIWVCWWQGENQMPELVQVCYKSLHDMMPNICDITLITEKNIDQYIEIPPRIMKLFNEGKITLTHLSDAIRVLLINKYGGFWVDATYYFARPLQKNEVDMPFFTRRRNSILTKGSVSSGRWSYNYIKGSEDDIFFHFLWDALEFYWNKHELLIDPLIMDYEVWLAYDCIPGVKERILKLPYTDSETTALNGMINDAFNEHDWNELLHNNKVFKLTYKKELLKKNKDGLITYWGYILDNYKEKNKRNICMEMNNEVE